ncbi:hypothetical protein PV325_009390 [Microctonus aethiopoides]|nr:hypothetical protein PV325_009390 [Microctonus aethiopoides]
MSIDCVPGVVYKQLIDELSKDYCWNKLAEHVAKRLGFTESIWIKSLENNGLNNVKRLPAENLLDQLNMRMCTVGILCNLLEECNLLRALSVFHQPEPLIITEQPNCDEADVNIALGEYFKLRCQAIGLPPPSYVWYHENLPLENQNSEEINLFIDNIEREGGYKCLIAQYDLDGLTLDKKFTNTVYLKVKPTRVLIKLQPLPFVEVEKDNVLELICNAESHPEPKYQWFRDNTKLEGQTFNILRIEGFQAKHEGKYYCQITNDISEIYSNKSIVVIDLPREKAVAKIALLIANEDYDHHEKLKTPKNDVAKLAELLEQIGFQVISLMNLTVNQMKNAMKLFCSVLSDGVYGLFYFAGHGFKMQESYMLAVDAPMSFLRSDAICESELLAMVLPTDPALLVVILDTCQTVPPKESNPDIHKELPTVNEYRSRKNLRNLIQAYSTSSHRPSYERANTDYGLYVTHLCKYITRDIPVQKIFEETGKSIDIWFKGKERNQIPMFALTITKPFRLTDAIYAGNLPAVIIELKDLITFPIKTCKLTFKQNEIHCNLIVSQLMKPYLNMVKLNVSVIDGLDINFYNSVAIQRNNLFRSSQRNEFHVHNPQINKGPLVISIERNGVPIGATLFQIMDFVPTLLCKL